MYRYIITRINVEYTVYHVSHKPQLCDISYRAEEFKKSWDAGKATWLIMAMHIYVQGMFTPRTWLKAKPVDPLFILTADGEIYHGRMPCAGWMKLFWLIKRRSAHSVSASMQPHCRCRTWLDYCRSFIVGHQAVFTNVWVISLKTVVILTWDILITYRLYIGFYTEVCTWHCNRADVFICIFPSHHITRKFENCDLTSV